MSNYYLIRSLGLCFLMAVFSSLAILGCSTVPERLTPSQVDLSNIPENDLFSDYIERSKNLIQASRVDLNLSTRDKIVQANAPFEYSPNPKQCKSQLAPFKYKHGILLIHGLTGSPYAVQELGRYFRARCFLVRSILLPGHGTRPGDLLDAHYQDWVKAVDYGVRSFDGQVEDLYLAGYSIGGALAFHHVISAQNIENVETALRKPEYSGPPIKGLFLFSPAFKARNGLVFLADTVSFFIDWMSITDDRDYAAYESFPYNAGAQSYQLIKEINQLMESKQNFSVPVFMVLSEDDESVDSEHSIEIFRRYMNNDKNQMQLYTRKPKQYVSDRKIQAFQSQLENKNILSFSHTSILLPRDNLHYGFQGDYRRCLHYPERSIEWLACTSDANIYQGETSQQFLEQHTIRQLTYNPYFPEMLIAMDRFLEWQGISQ